MIWPEDKTILLALDYFFLGFHSLLTAFNALGWIWRRTRRLHQLALFLTSFSWVILGYFYGWGYCFLTEWHWQVRHAMGNPIDSTSYTDFLLQELTGLHLPIAWVDNLTLGAVLFALVMNIILTIHERHPKSQPKGKGKKSP